MIVLPQQSLSGLHAPFNHLNESTSHFHEPIITFSPAWQFGGIAEGPYQPKSKTCAANVSLVEKYRNFGRRIDEAEQVNRWDFLRTQANSVGIVREIGMVSSHMKRVRL